MNITLLHKYTDHFGGIELPRIMDIQRNIRSFSKIK